LLSKKQIMADEKDRRPEWKEKLYKIIFQSDTFYGKLFDEILLVLILFSIGFVMLESITEIRIRYGSILRFGEWTLTILFLIEYILRIISSPQPKRYVLSFFGIIDLLAILPTFLTFIFPGVQPLIVIRALRLLRVYRILKLTRFIKEGHVLLLALRRSSRKIFIFMGFISVLVVMLGSIMYVVEGAENGFENIPLGIYWAVITLTTVGYGDIVPITALGKFIATFIMLLGYSIIAIPTGIVTSELSSSRRTKSEVMECKSCGETNHLEDSHYCKNCGKPL
jgi:voltage-gated potassium channel